MSMRFSLLEEEGKKNAIVVLDPEEKVVESLTNLAKERNLSGCSFTAIGAVSSVSLGYFDRSRKSYKKTILREQLEVLSLIGNIVLYNGEPRIHAHIVLGRPDAQTVGGHLLEATVWPTLEIVLNESPSYLKRRYDPAIGLALIDTTALSEPFPAPSDWPSGLSGLPSESSGGQDVSTPIAGR